MARGFDIEIEARSYYYLGLIYYRFKPVLPDGVNYLKVADTNYRNSIRLYETLRPRDFS